MSWFELQANQSAKAPMAQQSDAGTGFGLNNNWSSSPLIRSMARYEDATDAMMPSNSFLDIGKLGQRYDYAGSGYPGAGYPNQGYSSPGPGYSPPGYPTSAYPCPPGYGMPSATSKPNPWAAFGYGGVYNANFAPSSAIPDPTLNYGVPISGSVRGTINDINKSLGQAEQIKQEGLDAAAKAQQEQAAKDQQEQSHSEPGAYLPNGDEHAPANVPTTSTSKGIQVNAEGKVIAPTTGVTIDKVPDTVVDPTTGKERAPTEAEKKILQDQIDAQKKEVNLDAKTLTKDKREAASKALEILSQSGYDGQVQPSDFETAFSTPEAQKDPEVKKALEYIRDNAKTLAGTCGDENDHLSYEEVNFIKSKLDKGAWKSLDQAKDFGAERKLMKLVVENGKEESGFSWGAADENLELDGGSDYEELEKAIGDDDYTKQKLKEMKDKFGDFQKAVHAGNNESGFWGSTFDGDKDNWWNLTDGDEITDNNTENLLKAVENGWSFQQIIEKKDVDKQKDTGIENW